MDDKLKMMCSSMKTAKNVDEKMQTRPLVHEISQNHGWQVRNEVPVHEKARNHGWQAQK